MRYRIVALSAILLAASGLIMPVCAAGQQSWIFKGTCGKSTIAKSDGIQRGPAGGMMPTRDYLALMQQARANHQTLGPDGFLWSTEPLDCDSVLVVLKGDSSGHTVVSFSNDDAKTPVLGFAGKRIDGDGPLFLSDGVALGDQKDVVDEFFFNVWFAFILLLRSANQWRTREEMFTALENKKLA